MNWKDMFRATLSVKIKVNDRVKHRDTARLGTVYQTATVDDVPTLSVKHDDGTESQLVPSEEYFKVHTATQIWAGRGIGRQIEQ